MALGANYSFELIFDETCAPQFNGHNNSFLASVDKDCVSGNNILREIGVLYSVSPMLDAMG